MMETLVSSSRLYEQTFLFSGKNVTPTDLPAAQRKPLMKLCDRYLIKVIKLLGVNTVIGVGKFAADHTGVILRENGIRGVRVVRMMHPSPANPVANREWEPRVTAELVEGGVWETITGGLAPPPEYEQRLVSPPDINNSNSNSSSISNNSIQHNVHNEVFNIQNTQVQDSNVMAAAAYNEPMLHHTQMMGGSQMMPSKLMTTQSMPGQLISSQNMPGQMVGSHMGLGHLVQGQMVANPNMSSQLPCGQIMNSQNMQNFQVSGMVAPRYTPTAQNVSSTTNDVVESEVNTE